MRPWSLVLLLFSTWVAGESASAADATTAAMTFDISRVKHIIVIYNENWTFDGLYSQFPHADGYQAGAPITQLDRDGKPLANFSQVFKDGKPDMRFPTVMPATFNDLGRYLAPKDKTGDAVHAFYTEQRQIDRGANDLFVAFSNDPGLVTTFFDASKLPEGALAQEFTMCDHCFHSAFGGSFLNHQWLIAAKTPAWTGGDPTMSIRLSSTSAQSVEDRELSCDGTRIVNTVQTLNAPHEARGPKATHGGIMPALFTHRTIGTALDDANVTWAWYAGGWNDALAICDGSGAMDATKASAAGTDFQAHHQPFNYFADFADAAHGGDARTARNRQLHLKDETEFLAALRGNDLPAVCFVKPVGRDNDHPGYATVAQGQQHTADLVAAVRATPYWDDCAIFITYDEHGGRWDHVPPPVPPDSDEPVRPGDAPVHDGPGLRVPMIVVSPFARHGEVDHTPYETVSILAFIERRFGLKPLAVRDAKADPFSQAFR
jgi:phospholipase C